ncbi:MAG: aminoglycoside phosphotransferase family protein [Armatimonadetes bacterium]|nr:aminoglycoside phosphotransferase family protein [Akkermansiaceae bacterium]
MTIPEIASRFALPGQLVAHQEIPTGLINTTHAITCGKPDARQRFVIQALNPAVFAKPENVMENIQRISRHIGNKTPSSQQLSLVPTTSGNDWLTLPDGTIWRCYPFLEDTEYFVKITSPDLAFRAAAAFGDFQAKLSDLDPGSLHETIPDFHHTPAYFAKLIAAGEKNPASRLDSAQPEFDFIRSQKNLTALLIEARLPIRITHNDTKISNILFPLNPDLPPIVIDLDTVMPGLALFDFGDLVRSAAATADENEPDPTKIRLDPALTTALTDGYLSTASAFLTPAEIDLLPASVKVITLELAIRFLTDYLLGDVYFKTQSPGHNLLRARNQIALLKSI